MSSIRLVTNEAEIYEQNPLSTSELISNKNYVFYAPKGNFKLVGYVQHYENKTIHPLVKEAIANNIGVVYICDELPANPIVHPNIVYVKVGFEWFIHTLFINPLQFKGSFSDKESNRTARAFQSFTKYFIPLVITKEDLENLCRVHDDNREAVILDITGGLGDHLLCIPTIKTLAEKFKKKVYILCEPHRKPCFDNLGYIAGFFHNKRDVNISKFSKMYWLPFGDILNDYRLNFNKQNRVYSIAYLCGLSKDDLITDIPEIIFTEEEVKISKLKWKVYRNKLFFGFDSNRVDSVIPKAIVQKQIHALRSLGFTIFTASLRKHDFKECNDLSKQLSVRDLFGLISQMEYVLTIDTSFLHIAGALGKPIFTLVNYFSVDWRCSTYKNLKSFTPSVPCYPCVGGQFVSGGVRQCTGTRSCYDYFNWNIIIKTIKHFAIKYRGQIPTKKLNIIKASEKPIYFESLNEARVISSGLRIINPRKSNPNYHIGAFWMGGIGDSVMLGYLCRAIVRKYPDSVIDAFVRDPHQAQLFVFDYPNIRGSYSGIGWGATVGKHKNDYDIIYEFRHYPYAWYKFNPKLNKPFDKAKYDNWQLASKDIINTWDSEVFRYYAKQTDLELIDSDLRIPLKTINTNLDKGYLKKYGLPKNFMTVHSGCDRGVGKMKLWETKNWELLTARLLADNIPVIQIGIKADVTFPGVRKVEVNNLIDLAYILHRSKLHVDNEGGLVHIAHAVGTKSIVLFGATSPVLYGYKDNINIYKDKCPTCWWSNGSWSKQCSKGNSECINLTDISVSDVYTKIRGCYA